MLTSRYAAGVRIRRGFVGHGEGCLHLRWAGDGPALVALHESPRSSLSLLPLIDGLASHRTVVAFDTPGYGHSDPLDADVPTGEDYALAFARTLDALGLAAAPIYGTHTGAALAVELALRKPARVAALLLDGFAAFDREEQADFVGRYLAPFEPSWDGAHLAHLWSRCKDLFAWFPYHVRTTRTRLAFDPPGTAKVHDTVLGFLMAGPGYAKGYRCAGVLDAPGAAAALRVPTTVTARPHDLIHSHLERIRPTAHVRVERIGPSAEAWLGCVAAALPGTAAVPLVAGCTRAPHRGGWHRTLIELGAGYLHALERGAGDDADVVLGDLPDSAVRVAATLPRAHRRVIVLDPPGCGASDPLASAASAPPDRTLGDTVAALHAALDALGVRRCRIVGVGLGAVLAAALAARDPRVAIVAGVDVPAWARGAGAVPQRPVVPTPVRDEDGGALFTTWYRLRDRWLYDDAGSPAPTQRCRGKRLPDAHELHARYASLWIGPEAATLASALQEAVRGGAHSGANVRIVHDADGPLAALEPAAG